MCFACQPENVNFLNIVNQLFPWIVSNENKKDMIKLFSLNEQHVWFTTGPIKTLCDQECVRYP